MRARHLLNFDFRQPVYLKPTLRLVWDSAPRWLLAKIVLISINSVMPFVRVYTLKLLVDAVTVGFSAADKSTAYKQVVFYVILMGLINLTDSILGLLLTLVGTAHQKVTTEYMHNVLHSKAIELDLEHYENSEYYDILERAKGEANQGPMRLVNRLDQIGVSLIQLATMGGAIVLFKWWVVFLLVFPIFPRIFVRLKFVKIIHEWIQRRTKTQRLAGYYNNLLTTDNFAKEVRLFDLGELFKHRFLVLRKKLLQEELKLTAQQGVAEVITSLISSIAVWIAYAIIAYDTVQGKITVGDLILYNQAFRQSYGALWSVLNGCASLYEDNLYLSYLFQYLGLKPVLIEPKNPKPIPRPMKTGIVFDRVNFNYPGTTRQALKNISLQIKPGEVIGLVGENGSGKTTLIKLLCRLYEVNEGKITIDGIDVRELSIKELRKQISVIFQDYAKYHLTARENIWLGNIDCPLDGDEVLKAAYRSGADEVIKTLPKGYNTMLGKRFEAGEELSIGQWQKISIARAFLRDSQLIVLDEPTSALDPKAEYEVFKKFKELLQDQAAVLITHRLSTVRMADCIYVLDKGQIVESGSHDELMKLGGTYAHLFELQAKNYR
ncbi:MAG TPA: ABC transporter ATP-binding protein [Oscillatoriales cyanobacterium M59_W2019_021]|nr:ABC transporter ATP-binding protein [Oscillatoriales cyanobacterium M4454_W2019_049]HIK49887.1 ABC transporter ATP-binding protein [Oscillatoriales cyanobacterium M59_W2019_021]